MPAFGAGFPRKRIPGAAVTEMNRRGVGPIPNQRAGCMDETSPVTPYHPRTDEEK
jgi:hypothetical protein